MSNGEKSLADLPLKEILRVSRSIGFPIPRIHCNRKDDVLRFLKSTRPNMSLPLSLLPRLTIKVN